MLSLGAVYNNATWQGENVAVPSPSYINLRNFVTLHGTSSREHMSVSISLTFGPVREAFLLCDVANANEEGIWDDITTAALAYDCKQA